MARTRTLMNIDFTVTEGSFTNVKQYWRDKFICKCNAVFEIDNLYTFLNYFLFFHRFHQLITLNKCYCLLRFLNFILSSQLSWVLYLGKTVHVINNNLLFIVLVMLFVQGEKSISIEQRQRVYVTWQNFRDTIIIDDPSLHIYNTFIMQYQHPTISGPVSM